MRGNQAMALTPADGATANERTALAFLDTWGRQDVPAMLDYFTEDASYIDMPLPPRCGKAAIREYVEAIFAAFSVHIETLRIASAGDVVFTERVDVLTLNEGGRSVAVPVTGVMEFVDGRIALWREYLDLGTAEDGLGITIRPPREGAKALTA
jgi:limonene-1,2-epoxide hydrolase